MAKYVHLYGMQVKWAGLLAETVRTELPQAEAYQRPALSRAQLRDVVIPAITRRVERGVKLHRDCCTLPNLQAVLALASDLQALAALIQFADQQSDPAEIVQWGQRS